MTRKNGRRYLAILLALTISFAASVGIFEDASAGGPTDLGRAIAVQEANTNALMAIDGVIGTAVGFSDGGHVVLVFTEEPGIRGIPGAIEGVAVRPYVTGKIYAQPKNSSNGGGSFDTTAKTRPAPLGVSLGHPSITAGTLGARVKDGLGNVFVLSNNHVMADENHGSIGDPELQPGPYDGGTLADSIGTLHAFQPILFGGENNVIDAAIASTTTAVVDNKTPADGYGVPSSTPVDAVVGMNVQKYGRTTQQTNGSIDAINATINVQYDSGVARFVNQVIIKGRKGAFSAGGDSGSLIVSKDGRNPVALLFAGSNSITVGNPIGPVLAKFGVVIDGAGAVPSPNDAPVVTIAPPSDGYGLDLPSGSSTASVTFTGTANDAEDGDLSSAISWRSNIDGNLGTGASVDASLHAGVHTITASVTDSGGAQGSDSITVIVTDPNAEAMHASITFSDSNRGPNTDLNFTITVKDAGGSPLQGAAVESTLSRVGTSWSFVGTTNSSGETSGQLRNARVGTVYTLTVNGVTLSGYAFEANADSTASWLVGTGPAENP